ncbi:MAG TPA: hypothetical protein VGE55_06445 [Limnobacter sp.]|uniref:hypothetical protein n=1 Tax=Limnobacter sp. TaxID=2003368 RepID=UPI002ED9D778
MTLYRTLGMLLVIASATGCSTNPKTNNDISPSVKNSGLYLSEETIKKSNGSMEILDSIWLTLTTNDHRKLLISNEEITMTQDAVRDGLQRFCSYYNNSYNETKTEFGWNLECKDRKSNLAGTVTIVRYNTNISPYKVSMEFEVNSPERIARKLEQEKLSELKKQRQTIQKGLNGPRGTLYTTDGTYRFIRIGTMTETDVRSYYINDKEYLSEDLEYISRVAPKSSDFEFKAKGKPASKQTWYSPVEKFVINDKKTGYIYARAFNPADIIKIEFDSNQPEKDYKIYPTSSNVDFLSEDLLEKYRNKMINEATILANKKETKNLLNAFSTPDGNSIVFGDSSERRMFRDDIRYTFSPVNLCRIYPSAEVQVIISLEDTWACREIQRERNILERNDARITPEILPLYFIHLVKTLQRRVK